MVSLLKSLRLQYLFGSQYLHSLAPTARAGVHVICLANHASVTYNLYGSARMSNMRILPASKSF